MLYGERRGVPRNLIRLNKLFSVNLKWGQEEKHCYLYLVDLSETGLRICSDFPFPDQEVEIRMEMNPALKIRGRKVWQKEMPGGMWTVGIKLSPLNPGEIEWLRGVIERFSSERRQVERVPIKLNRLYPAGVEAMGYWQACFVYLIDISEAGMKLTSDFLFPLGEDIPLQLGLESPLRLKVRAIWCRKLDYSTHIIGLRFMEMDEENRKILRKFIEMVHQNNGLSNPCR